MWTAGRRKAGFGWFFLGVLALALGAPTCVWSGLDAYSSEYGKPSDGMDGGPGQDAAGMPDADTCACGAGQMCVQGQCELCTETWVVDHKALRQGDVRILDHHYDKANHRLYVTSSRQEGQQPRRGYMAEIHTCNGKVLREIDGQMVNANPLPGLLDIGGTADMLYARIGSEDPAKIGFYARYNKASGLFDELLEVDLLHPGAAYQASWTLGISPGGKLWSFGDWAQMSPGTPIPLLMRSDGQGNACVGDLANLSGFNGRAIAFSGRDVYLAAVSGTDVRIQHYDEDTCDIATCNCPLVEELPPLVLAMQPVAFEAKVVGSVLVFVGFSVKGDTDWSALAAQYNFATKTWNSVYSDDPTLLLDGFTALDSDGSYVYAAGFKNYVYNDPTFTQGDVYVFPLPILSSATPAKIPMGKLRAGFALDLDGDGFIISGYSSDSAADGRTVRCKLDACP